MSARNEVGWSVVGCSGVACAVWWSAVGWMSHETKEWFRKWLEGQADPKRELVPLAPRMNLPSTVQ